MDIFCIKFKRVLRKALIIVILILPFNAILIGQDVGVGLGPVNYFMDYHPFTDAMKCVRWIDVASWDSNGFPTSANSGRYATGRIGIASEGRLPDGEYVLTWEGEGDVIFYNSIFTLVSEDLSGPIKRRVYDVETLDQGIGVRIISFPATNIKLWIPGYENYPSIWNPEYTCYLSSFENSVLRFMDVGRTNNSDESTWLERTPDNWSSFVNQNNHSTAYDVVGGVSYEAMMELCNEMNSDMWVCVPHLADSTYIHNLCLLYTSDAADD